jgi:hypothetical protein
MSDMWSLALRSKAASGLGVEMKTRTKAIYINSAIAAGLVLELYWGRSFYVVGISGVILFALANLILVFSNKQRDR